MKKIKLPVKGMFCAHCSKTVGDTLTNLGVIASVDLAANMVYIKYDETKITLEKMKRAIKKAGYDLIIEEKESHWPMISLIIGIVLTLPFFVWILGNVGVPIPDIFNNGIFQLVLASLMLIIIGSGFYKRAFYQIKMKNLGMDVLVSSSTTIAFILSIYNLINGGMLYFEATAMVLCFVNIGHTAADKIKKKTGRALEELTKLQVKEAEVITKKGSKMVPLEDVEVDDIVNVKIGEKIPLDGIIIEGETSIDESLISGESKAVKKASGQEVYGGSLNLTAKILVRITKNMDDSLLGQIIEQVNLASINKPKLQKTSDKVANIFVPTVFAIAIFTFILNFLILGKELNVSIIRAVSVLVVSCPCALGLAVPMSVLVGYSLAAKRGVLFHNGESFETLHNINAVAFDKTGTLSYGKLKIADKYGDDKYLSLIRFLETSSSHPIAKSLCEEIEDIQEYPNLEVKEIAGLGIDAKDDKHHYLLGSQNTIKEIPDEYQEFIGKNSRKTLVFLSIDGELKFAIALDDVIKETSLKAIQGLHSKNIRTYMITGDKKEIALETARLLDIPEDCVYYEVSPLDKADIIKKIQKEGYRVSFVGDGVNDALALQTSDLGMSVRSGSDIALLASDVTLMNSDLNSVYKTIQISNLIYNNIIQNFIWALCYNLVMIPLALLGIMSPIVSAICMGASNILVVLNALRLYLKKEVK